MTGWGRRLVASGLVLLLLLPLSCAITPRRAGPALAPGAPAPVWDLLALVRSDPERPVGLAVERRNVWREVRTTVVSPVPAAIRYPVQIPPAALLDLAFAVEAEGEPLDEVPPVRFRVVLTDEAGAQHVLLERVVDLRTQVADRRWLDAHADLGPFAGRTGTLSFHADAEGSAPPAAMLALFGAPRILPQAQADEPNVLLVTIDCLRADHVHAYGYERRTTPTLDRLSAEGVRFAHAYTNAPMTLPSLAQLFSSKLFPSAADATWLAPFHAAGVPSTAIVNNPYLALWQIVRDPEGRDSFDRLSFEGNRNARAITDQAIAELDRNPGTRFVLYLHYLDAHSPYALIPEGADPFGDPSYRGRVTQSFNDVAASADRYSPADRQRVIDWYDAGVHWIDQNLGRLIDHLRADGRLDRTLVVATADHGEELWDHGRFFHGQSLYDELLHVPLVVRLPGAAQAGTVVERAVRSIDIAPAILEWTGLPAPAGFTGRSLAQAIARPNEPADVLIATATSSTFPTRYGVRTAEAKLVETLSEAQRELFDLAADPQEQRDVLAERPALAEALGAQLAAARGPLWRSGYQLRIVGSGGAFRLRLHSEQSQGAFVTLDRAGSRGPRLRLDREGRTLTLSGVVGSETLAVRFERQHFGQTSDPVELTLQLTQEAEVHLGAGARVLRGAEVDLLDPALDASEDPPCSVPSAGVRVCLWRSPGAGVATTPGAPDAETRERLRALGYTE
jgi:arylsulfatase A-like enzyme